MLSSLPHILRRWWPVVALVVFFACGTTGYAAGYRLVSGPMIERLVTVTLTNLPKESTIYVDNIPNGIADTEKFSLTLIPGNHAILVSANGFLPWNTIVFVPKKNIEIPSFLVPTSPTVTILKGSDAIKVQKDLNNYVLPSLEKPLVLAGGCAIAYISHNQIIGDIASSTSCVPPSFLCDAGSCAPTIVFSPTESMTSVIPYPGRDDALLISVGSHVYALAFDPRDPRTFASVLQGRAPEVLEGTAHSVVGKDGPTLFSLTLPK